MLIVEGSINKSHDTEKIIKLDKQAVVSNFGNSSFDGDGELG